jgi:hypothetical protein
MAVLFALATVSASGVVLASPAGNSHDPKAAARKKLIEGAEQLKRGEYQAALTTFQSAYDLVPSPKIQFNFGLALMGLGRNADALESFHTFLSEASDASTETITKARVYKEALVQKICRLTLRADVEGASIGIDGRSYGKTPRVAEILLDAGTHLLVVEKVGIARSFTKRFDAAPGSSLTVEARLIVPEPPPVVVTRAKPRNRLQIEAVPPPEPNTGPHAPWLKWTGLVTGGLAVAALGFGTVEWIVKEQKYRKFNDTAGCDVAALDMGGATCTAFAKDGDSARRLAYVGFAVAGALGVVSTVFLLVDRRGHATAGTESALACAPSLTVPGGSCSLRF